MIPSISASGLSQDVLQSGYSNQQQSLQDLQNNLASGNLSGATSAFQSLQTVLQNSTSAARSTLWSNSQLATDMTALGNALSSGDLPGAQSAFATVLGDLKNFASSAQINEANAASQSVQLVESLLSSLDSGSPSASSLESTTSLLQSVYGSHSVLNVYG